MVFPISRKLHGGMLQSIYQTHSASTRRSPLKPTSLQKVTTTLYVAMCKTATTTKYLQCQSFLFHQNTGARQKSLSCVSENGRFEICDQNHCKTHVKELFSKFQTVDNKENVLRNKYFKRTSIRIPQISGRLCSEQSVLETFIFQNTFIGCLILIVFCSHFGCFTG